ncbi:MAG: dihydropteroate synthase [Sulfuritalea sp.]|nr:dihydropteroate synthase [Sulfuritalea sp.]
MFVWQTSRFEIDLSRPKVMGVVNVTPDSFSDGGEHFEIQSALTHCEQLLREGADILDIGGESSRPGALALSLKEELARVIPVVRHAVTLGVPVSVDTYKPSVMQAVLDLGADIINDIWALRWSDPQGLKSALDVVSDFDSCGLCLMHMHRDPQTMQTTPMQGDVVAQVTGFLAERLQALERKGISRQRICIDPGIGFGKTVEQNFALLAHQKMLLALDYPVVAGWSRKSSLGAVTGAPADDRMAASVAAAVLAVERGAHIVRVHDVKATVQGLKVLEAMQNAESKENKNQEKRQ